MIHFVPKHEDLKWYSMPLLVPREVGREAPGVEIIGTGILFQIGQKRFCVTARHVADLADETDLLYPASADKAVMFSGDRARTNPALDEAPAPIRNLDLAILTLGDAPVHPRYRFLGSGQLYNSQEPIEGGIGGVAVGYPSGRNKTFRNSPRVSSEQMSMGFITAPIERYESLGLHPGLHLAFEHDKEVIHESGQTGPLPKLKGMSGGGMWLRVPGNRYALAGITSDHLLRDRVVFGTRIQMVNGLIRDYLQGRPAA